MISITTSDKTAFDLAVSALSKYADNGKTLKTQNFSVAIALLMYRDKARAVPSPVSPLIFEPSIAHPPLPTRVLEISICDALYEKVEGFVPQGGGPIYKPFTQSFKPKSSTKGQNNWRNSFDLQAGISCDAPFNGHYLQSKSFLAQHRYDCDYRDPNTGRCSSPSGLTGSQRTCFNPSKHPDKLPGPDSAAKPSPKLLTRHVGSDNKEAYWIIEPTEEVLVDLLGDPSKRVPLYPFIAALYAGSVALTPARTSVDRAIFQSDIGLDDTRFLALFDPDPTSEFNQRFLLGIGNPNGSVPVQPTGSSALGSASPSSWGTAQPAGTQVSTLSNQIPATSPYITGRDLSVFLKRSENTSDPTTRLRLLEKATRGHARALDELAKQISSLGVIPTEQDGGYDLFVEFNSTGHLFEAKTWRHENFRSQVRAGVAQLYEYKWRNRHTLPTTTHLYLVFDRKPPLSDDDWIWDYLHSDRNIVLCWLQKGKLTTRTASADAIAWLSD